MRQWINHLRVSVLLVFAFSFLALLPHTAFAAPAHKNAAKHNSAAQSGPSNLNLVYGGGFLMTGNISVYTIFWQPTGSTIDPQYSTLINRFFNDYNQLSTSNILKQYPNSTGATVTSVSLGGTWTDTQQYPDNPLSIDQVQQEITHAMQINGWTASLQHVFFLYPVASEGITVNGCGAHNSFGNNTIYAFVQDDDCTSNAPSPNNDPDADSAISVSLHELAESITDPIPFTGWVSGGEPDQEVADLCAFNFGPSQPAFNGGDIAAGNDFYMVEELWSNAYSICALDYTTVTPTITITSPHNGYAISLHSDLTITVTASSPDAAITQVTFFDNGSFLGKSTTAPFTFDTVSLSVGSYTLTAVAQDSRYSTATSTAIQVSVDPQSCQVHYQMNSQQSNTFSASVTITNTGQGDIVDWSLLFNFSGNQQITQLWGANFVQNGNQVNVFNLSYNPDIPPNGQASIGFNASFSGTNTNPTSFELNGTSACTVV
jgi:hypothetical protein